MALSDHVCKNFCFVLEVVAIYNFRSIIKQWYDICRLKHRLCLLDNKWMSIYCFSNVWLELVIYTLHILCSITFSPFYRNYCKNVQLYFLFLLYSALIPKCILLQLQLSMNVVPNYIELSNKIQISVPFMLLDVSLLLALWCYGRYFVLCLSVGEMTRKTL